MTERNTSGERPAGPGYETRDVDPRAIGVSVATFVLLLVGSLAGLRGLLRFYEVADRRDSHPASLQIDQTPPEPRLQVSEVDDFDAFFVKQEKILNGYGWEDREANVVRIPIDRAMDLIAERGLSPLKAPQPSASDVPQSAERP